MRETIIALGNTHTLFTPVQDEILHNILGCCVAGGWIDELRLALTLPKSPVEY